MDMHPPTSNSQRCHIPHNCEGALITLDASKVCYGPLVGSIDNIPPPPYIVNMDEGSSFPLSGNWKVSEKHPLFSDTLTPLDYRVATW